MFCNSQVESYKLYKYVVRGALSFFFSRVFWQLFVSGLYLRRFSFSAFLPSWSDHSPALFRWVFHPSATLELRSIVPSLRGIIALGFVSMPIPVFLESYGACKAIVMWCHVLWCNLAWCDVMWCDVMQRNRMGWHPMWLWCDVFVRCGWLWGHVMWRDVVWDVVNCCRWGAVSYG